MTVAIDQRASDLDPNWPPQWARAAETRTVFPWYVVVSVDAPHGWETPTVGVTETEAASTTAMSLALRNCGLGCMGVVKRARHHMSRSEYEYGATVCTATIDPATGLVVIDRPGTPQGMTDDAVCAQAAGGADTIGRDR